jgi:transcriptional regulator with XRE-family HTH domain
MEKRLGIDELCRRLGVAEAAVRSWQTGGMAMPDEDFLKLIDLVTDVEPDFWAGGKP